MFFPSTYKLIILKSGQSKKFIKKKKKKPRGYQDIKLTSARIAEVADMQTSTLRDYFKVQYESMQGNCKSTLGDTLSPV